MASVPLALSVGKWPNSSATSTAAGNVTSKPLTMMSINDYNMAGCEWGWDFVLEKVADGSFSATATQYDKWAEYDKEPWELDTHLSLQNGHEICSAVQSMAGEAGYHADAEYLERVAAKLDAYDPVLAAEFRSEIMDLSEEWGWEDIHTIPT